jgi:CrcB protein
VTLGEYAAGALPISATLTNTSSQAMIPPYVFPWATFTVNLTGCLAIGLISATLIDRHHLPAWLRIGLVIGVVGGYTTFSTFAQESLDLVDARDLAEAILYVGGSVVLGMIAVYLGRSLRRSF